MNRARTWLVGVLVTAAVAWTACAGEEAAAPVEESAPTNQAFRVEAPPDGLPGYPDALPLCPPVERSTDIHDLFIILPLFGVGWALTRAVRHWRNRRQRGPGQPPPTPSIR